MRFFLIFILLVAIAIFVRFLYDTYVKGERYAPNGERLPSRDEIANMRLFNERNKISKEEYLTTFIDLVKQKKYDKARTILLILKDLYPDDESIDKMLEGIKFF